MTIDDLKALSPGERDEAIDVLYDLLETLMKCLLEERKGETVPFSAYVKKKVQEKVTFLANLSPAFEEAQFPTFSDTGLPPTKNTITGIRKALTTVSGEGIPYKTFQIMYECFTRFLFVLDALKTERK